MTNKKRSQQESQAVGDDGGGGGSRASKKRAKKRQQKMLMQKKQSKSKNSENPMTGDTSNDVALKTDENIKIPIDDKNKSKVDDRHLNICIEKQGKDVEVRRSKDKELKTISDTTKETSNDTTMETSNDLADRENEEEAFAQVLCELKPLEILFPQEYTVTESKRDDEGSIDNEPDPYELMQSVTSRMKADILFRSLLLPAGITPEIFYLEYWEKKPLLISQSKNMARLHAKQKDTDRVANPVHDSNDTATKKKYQGRFDGLLSKKDIKQLISNQVMRYGKDLNITNYCESTGGKGKRRITLDQLADSPEDDNELEYIVADSKDVWSNFTNGCTIRLLCPHKYNDRIHSLLSTLEDEFGCMVGANCYLTPGGSPNQGFAPHYDDIEAFVIQLEGYKHWKVYPPMSKQETLPRESSRDFTEEEVIKDMEMPMIDVELGPGDLLYMPRGWIHQATSCRREHHSLHLTISAMQNWAWVDLLELIMPEAIEAVAQSRETTSLRSGLPRNFLSYMGTMHEQNLGGGDDLPEGLKQIASKIKSDLSVDSKEDIDYKKVELQNAFKADAKKKIMRVCKQALSMVTTGTDVIGKRFLSDRLPPSFTPQEAALTSENRALNGGKIWPNTMVRIAKPGLARLVVEDGKAVLYHSADNSRVYHEHPLSPMEFEIDDAPALEMLITTIEPHWICVRDLIHGDIEDKMEITQSLYDEGILAIFQNENPDAC